MSARPAPLVAHREVQNHADGDHTLEIVVTLSPVEWRMLLGDVARKLVARWGKGVFAWMLRAGDPLNTAGREDALTRFINELAMPRWSVRLNGDETAALIDELDLASLEIETCVCGRAVDVPAGGDRCGQCIDRSDLRIVRGV